MKPFQGKFCLGLELGDWNLTEFLRKLPIHSKHPLLLTPFITEPIT
jgi:hypothetical protein